MKANRLAKTSQQSARPKWARVAFIAVLIAAAASPAMAGFTGGPSVRVIPNDKVEIRWTASFTGDGRVEVFDNPDGTGTPIDTKVSVAPALDHTITFNVGGLIKTDTTYYFKVTHHDPTNNFPDLTNDPAPFPLFFTGAQTRQVGDSAGACGALSAFLNEVRAQAGKS
jgi:hypothetical protein